MLVTLSHPNLPDIRAYLRRGRPVVPRHGVCRGIDAARAAQAAPALAPATVMEWGRQICRRAGLPAPRDALPVVYRDVKPSNIMLDLHGQIK